MVQNYLHCHVLLPPIIYRAVYPPSTGRETPVIQLASSLANTTATLAISSGNPGPFNGWRRLRSSKGVMWVVVSLKMAVCVSVYLVSSGQMGVIDYQHSYSLGRWRSPGSYAGHNPRPLALSDYSQRPWMHSRKLIGSFSKYLDQTVVKRWKSLTVVQSTNDTHDRGYVDNPTTVPRRMRGLFKHLC